MSLFVTTNFDKAVAQANFEQQGEKDFIAPWGVAPDVRWLVTAIEFPEGVQYAVMVDPVEQALPENTVYATI